MSLIAAFSIFLLVQPSLSTNPGEVVSQVSGKCWDLPGGDDTNGNQIWQWDCSGSDNQQWNFDEETGTLKLATNGNKCLDVMDGDFYNGAQLQIWDCAGWPQQQVGFDWDMGVIYFSATATSSDASKCVDLTGGSFDNGGALAVWDCLGSANQQFWYTLPENFDVRTAWPGCGTEILNQGGCGSCWAFGTIEAISDRFCIMGEYVTLSPQPLVSCSLSKGGCGGGATSNAYRAIVSYGLQSCTDQCTSGCEPYGSGPNNCQGAEDTLKDRCYGCDEQCHDGSTAAFYKATSYTKTTLDTNQENVMAEIRAHGSITAGLSVYANWQGWVKNNGDVVYDTHAGSAHVGAHAIKISGYGVSDGKKYWLVQNSWGPGFGNGGYIKMLRGGSSEENGILWDKAEWAYPVLQSMGANFTAELLSDVSPIETAPDDFPITGGWSTGDHTHPFFQELAQTVFAESNAPGVFYNLTQVETQVVAGFNGRFTIASSWGPLRVESRHHFDGSLLGPPLVAALVV